MVNVLQSVLLMSVSVHVLHYNKSMCCNTSYIVNEIALHFTTTLEFASIDIAHLQCVVVLLSCNINILRIVFARYSIVLGYSVICSHLFAGNDSFPNISV